MALRRGRGGVEGDGGARWVACARAIGRGGCREVWERCCVCWGVGWCGLVVDGFEHSLSGVDIFSTAEARGQRAMASFQVGGRRTR